VIASIDGDGKHPALGERPAQVGHTVLVVSGPMKGYYGRQAPLGARGLHEKERNFLIRFTVKHSPFQNELIPNLGYGSWRQRDFGTVQQFVEARAKFGIVGSCRQYSAAGGRRRENPQREDQEKGEVFRFHQVFRF